MITSKDSLTYKKLLKLHKKKERDLHGLYLIEGSREIVRAPKLEEIYYYEETDLVKQLKGRGVKAIELAKHLFKRVCYREEATLIALVKKAPNTLNDLQNIQTLLVVEGIEKPGNLGAMLRTADAAGVSGVIVSNPACDIYNPNVIRASLGAFFTLPIVVTTNEEVANFLEKKGVQIVVTSPHATKTYFDVDYLKATAVVVGSEKSGVSKFWERSRSEKVKIPMRGEIDSLNASVAASLVVYEVLRQQSS